MAKTMDCIQIDSDLLGTYVEQLAGYGAVGDTGVTRPVYSPAWREAQSQVESWCQEAGLDVRRDAVGNVWGKLRGADGGPAIVSGSHIDTQTPGGRYDGSLGVIAAIVAARALMALGKPRRTLEVVSLAEEEGSRFPAANMWGTRGVTGTIAPDEPYKLEAPTGETVADAMEEVGLDPELIPTARRTDIDTFIEMHIEQGPVLEDAGVPVGIVNAITGVRHYVVDVVGRTDHAGARPMTSRLDALAAAAAMTSGVIGIALEMGPPAVTTVGRISAEPNLPAAVPGRVTFTVDSRHPDPAARDRLYASQEKLIAEVAEERGLAVRWNVTIDVPPCRSDPALVALLEETARRCGIATVTMHSGAGHDTQRMASIAKVAMIFVQSLGGRSHTPEEFTALEHSTVGTELLASALYRLVY